MKLRFQFSYQYWQLTYGVKFKWGRSLVQIAHFVHLFKDNLIYETTKVTQCVNFADKIQRPLHISLISCHVLQYFTPFNWFYTLGGTIPAWMKSHYQLSAWMYSILNMYIVDARHLQRINVHPFQILGRRQETFDYFRTEINGGGIVSYECLLYMGICCVWESKKILRQISWS